MLKKIFFFLIFFPFVLFSSDLDVEIFSSKISIDEKLLNSEITIDISDDWKLYSNKKSKNGSPLKIILNNESKNISNIKIDFPQSIEEEDDFFYINKQKIPIKFEFIDQIILDTSDFLIVNYIICNKKSGECIKNTQNISLEIKNNV